MKLKKAFQYQLASGAKLLGWTLVWVAVAIVIIPFITAALTGRLGSLNGEDFLPSGILEIALMACLVFYSASTYDSFQLMIQNGIGRNTYFYSKTLVIGTLALVGNLVSVLYNLLVMPFNTSYGQGTATAVLEGFYYNFFSNNILNDVMSFILLVLLTICISATFTFMGSILSLFERRTQIALIIGVPIILIIALIVVGNAGEETSLKSTWIAKVLLWIAGESGNSGTEGLNPFHPLFSGILYSVILFGGTYFFNLKLKTPR